MSCVTKSTVMPVCCLDAPELRLELGAGYLVHRAEGLVHEQQLRRGGQGAGYADALLLPAADSSSG